MNSTRTDTASVTEAFWAAMHELSEEEQKKLLRLVTGYPNVPSTGFEYLKPKKFNLTITADPSRFPVAHTCFNQLDIPPVTNKDEMLAKLKSFIECSDGSFTLS